MVEPLDTKGNLYRFIDKTNQLYIIPIDNLHPYF